MPSKRQVHFWVLTDQHPPFNTGAPFASLSRNHRTATTAYRRSFLQSSIRLSANSRSLECAFLYATSKIVKDSYQVSEIDLRSTDGNQDRDPHSSNFRRANRAARVAARRHPWHRLRIAKEKDRNCPGEGQTIARSRTAIRPSWASQ